MSRRFVPQPSPALLEMWRQSGEEPETFGSSGEMVAPTEQTSSAPAPPLVIPRPDWHAERREPAAPEPEPELEPEPERYPAKKIPRRLKSGTPRLDLVKRWREEMRS